MLHHHQPPNQHPFPPKYSGQWEGGREKKIPPVTSQYAPESFQAYTPNEIPLTEDSHPGLGVTCS